MTFRSSEIHRKTVTSWMFKDELAYYRYKFVDLVKPGPQKVEVYMGPGEEADCKWK